MPATPRTVLHLLPNAHLDPVWLWDWREGLNEGISTTRTILDLMDECPDLTFVRGESALYQHLERADPATFRRLARQVAAGRWDVVGGTFVQPDTNLPATETFARLWLVGQRYFTERFGRPVRVAWAADSFGHSAGLPEILAAAGIEGYCFGRPAANLLPLPKAAFWWEAASGARVLAYRISVGWYGSERDEMPRRLDQALATGSAGDLKNVGVWFGLGNHGGGPTRRHIEDIRQWAQAHPDVQVVFSGLHRLIDAVREEAAEKGAGFLPVFRGELNFCLRGCYASGGRFKARYRAAEGLVSRAETVDAAVSALLGRQGAQWTDAWEALLFNSFHDILPGSSIERAYGEQLDWLGGAAHAARRAEFEAMNALAARVDTRVPPTAPDHPTAAPMLALNPHPREYRGPIELEASLDYRPIWSYQGRARELPLEVRGPDGKLVPFQVVPTEHASMPHLAWRKRVVLQAALPPLGWGVFQMGWVEGARRVRTRRPARASARRIENGIYRVEAKEGASGVRLFRKGSPVLEGRGLQLVTVEDPWGSWGDMRESPAAMNLSKVRHLWKVAHVEALESGPQRAMLWVRLEGGASRLDLSFCLYSGREAVDVHARLFWSERSARLKMVLPLGASEAEFEVPGGVARRGAVGEVPGGRWVRVHGARCRLGFASDALYCFDCTRGALRATLVRGSRYADDRTLGPKDEPWQPATDQGEHTFRFVLSPGGRELPRLADELERPPVVAMAAPSAGDLPRTGAIAALHPATVRLLALKVAEDGRGFVLRAQETVGRPAEAAVDWLGHRINLGPMKPREIATWRISRVNGKRAARRSSIVE